MKVLALCGSIRNNSSNHALLVALQKNLTSPDDWYLYPLVDLPFFDPELQFAAVLPKSVHDLRARALAADYIVVATPEYAHGIPGILKNALEWLICTETMKKKVVIIIGSGSGGEYVRQALCETLKTMDLNLSEDRTLVITNARNNISMNGDVSDADLKMSIENFAANLKKNFVE